MHKTYTHALIFDKNDLGIDENVRTSLGIHYKRNLYIDRVANNPGSTIIRTTEDECLKTANSLGFDFAILSWEGNIFDIYVYHDACIEYANKLDQDTDGNWLVAGHIMNQHENRLLHNAADADDWKNSFYLFPITAIVNVKKWAELGCPAWGQGTDSLQTVIGIDAGTENVHDNYTPLIIKPTTAVHTDVKVKKGWNIINESMKAGYAVHNLNARIRQYQTYLYPEVNVDKYNNFWTSMYSLPKITDNYRKAFDQVFSSKDPRRIKHHTWQCFIRNTEKYFPLPDKGVMDYSDTDAFILPCSGFKDFIVTMSKQGPRKNTTVIHFDILPECVEIRKKIIERWDGSRHSFKSTLEAIALEYKDSYEQVFHMHNMKDLIEAYDHLVPYFHSEQDLEEQWQLFKNCQHHYISTDILDEPFNVFKLLPTNAKKVYLHLSDIPGWRNNIIGYGCKNLREDIMNCLRPLQRRNIEGIIDYKDPASDLQYWHTFSEAVNHLQQDVLFINDYRIN
jgi:hypothetical protein